MRKIEIKVFLLIIALFVLLSNLNESYAKYLSSVSSSTNVDFRTWKIFINNTNVTSNYNTTMNFTPTIISRSTVKKGKFAPGSTGYFDIYIDTSNVQTSYRVDMDIVKTGDISNLKVIGYSMTQSSSPDNSFQEEGNTYPDTNHVSFNKNLPSSGKFTNYYLRIFFKWIDEYGGISTNDSDSQIGSAYSRGQNVTYNISISMTFTQIN